MTLKTAEGGTELLGDIAEWQLAETETEIWSPSGKLAYIEEDEEDEHRAEEGQKLIRIGKEDNTIELVSP